MFSRLWIYERRSLLFKGGNTTKQDVIFGLPSIKFYKLLPILELIKPLGCCEICSDEETEKQRSAAVTETAWTDENRTTMTTTTKRDSDTAIAIDKTGMKPKYFMDDYIYHPESVEH